MNTERSVSVVIPLYNKAPHVARAIESVIGQTVRPREIIIIDDGSTDGSADIARSIKDDSIVVVSQANRGVSAARNCGVELAKSELIAFLDADDEWHPNFLECVTDLARDYPSAGTFSTAFQFRSADGKIVRCNFGAVQSQPGLIEDYFRAACVLHPFCSSSVMVPKRVLQEVGGFPEGVVMGEDLDTWMRIAFRYKIAWTPAIGATVSLDACNRAGHITYKGDIPLARTLEKWQQDQNSSVASLYFATEYVHGWRLFMVASNWLTDQPDVARELLRKTRGTKLFRYNWIRWRLITLLPHSWSTPLWRWKQRLAGRPAQQQPSRPIYRN